MGRRDVPWRSFLTAFGFNLGCPLGILLRRKLVRHLEGDRIGVYFVGLRRCSSCWTELMEPAWQQGQEGKAWHPYSRDRWRSAEE